MRSERAHLWAWFCVTALVVLTLLPVRAAFAGPVLSWDVTAIVEFDTAATTFTAGTGGTTNTASVLAWGTPTNATGQNPGLEQSKLVIAGSPAMGIVLTGGPPVAGPTVTHENNVITASSKSLDLFKVDVSITLVPTAGPPNAPGYGTVPPFDTPVPLASSFSGKFNETINHPAGGSCLGGGKDGVGINDNGCADIFALLSGDLSFKFPYPNPQPEGPPILFYIGTLHLEGLTTLPDPACTALGLPSGCKGFLTREVADNTLFPTLTIDVMVMPEPATLGLLGLGLLGLAVAGRIRRK